MTMSIQSTPSTRAAKQIIGQAGGADGAFRELVTALLQVRILELQTVENQLD
jgi:hypothetical protein